MARDYKHRAAQGRKVAQSTGIPWWKWLLAALSVALFVLFLVSLKGTDNTTATSKVSKPIPVAKKKTSKTVKKQATVAPEEPRYDFYTILPETEVVVPDYEINIRSREEQLGKGKTTKYLLQAGSFREFSEADKLRAQLALMGIESRVEKAKVGNATWNRVKLGPYSQSSSVSVIKKRLRNSGIDVIVTEIKG